VIDHYDWPGGREAMLRFGPARSPVVIVAMPLFEEANRTRALVVTITRALAERGIASALPDLPGTGESLVSTEEASLSNWQQAFLSSATQLGNDHVSVHSVAIRGGTLIDTNAPLASRWHLSPATGEALVRDLLRARGVAAQESGDPIEPDALALPGSPVELAGNYLSQAMIADLQKALPSATAPIRTLRLETDAQPADRKIAAAPLWRRSEPDNDVALARLLAGDIAEWITLCAG
jgi:hypothetical protein